jgi:hypothetical protein
MTICERPSTRSAAARSARSTPALAGRDPQAVFAKDGLFDELKKALAERVLNAKIDDHLDGVPMYARGMTVREIQGSSVTRSAVATPVRSPHDALQAQAQLSMYQMQYDA